VKPRIRRRKEVAADIIEIARYIASDSIDAALRFFDAVEETFKALASMPGMGGKMELKNLPDVRSFPVRGFPNHLVIYRPIKGGVEILAVLHGARKFPPIALKRRRPDDHAG